MVAKGQLNKLVDEPLHPYFKVDAGYILLDGFLHALVEQNPSESFQKFLKYNLIQKFKLPKRMIDTRIKNTLLNLVGKGLASLLISSFLLIC